MQTALTGILINYAVVSLRNLWRHKTTAFINIFGLAIGIGCSILAFAFSQYHLSWNRHIPEAGRVYRILWESKDGSASAGTSGPLAPALLEMYPEVEAAARVDIGGGWVMVESGAFQTDFDIVDPTVFDLFGYELLAGDSETVFKAPYSAVITASTADRVYGTRDVIGRTVAIEGYTTSGDYLITGVIDDPPVAASRNLRPRGFLTTSRVGSRSHERASEVDLSWELWQTSGFRFIHTFIRLRSAADAERLEAKLPSLIADTMGKDAADKYAYRLQPVSDIHLHGGRYGLSSSSTWEGIKSIYLVGGICSLILLVGCVNFVNLSTARAWVRRREIGIRKATGALRRDVVAQFMCESFLTTSIAAIAGVVFARLATPLFREHSGFAFPDAAFADHVIAGVAVLVVIVSLLAGAYPAFVVSGFNPARALKSSTVGNRGRRLKEALSILQFAACVLLILGTIVISRQTDFLMNKDLGFDRDMIITMPIFVVDRGRKPNYGEHLSYRWQRLKREVLEHPNIVSASAFAHTPGLVGDQTAVVEAGGKREEIRLIRVDTDYLDLFDIAVTQGRNFSNDRDVTRGKEGFSFILNESAVKYLGWDKPESGGPIGKPFNLRNSGWEPSGTVVGVIEDFHASNLRHPVRPLALLYSVHILRDLGVKIRPHNVPETIAFLETFWERHLPERPFQYSFLNERIDRQYRRERQTATLMSDFSILGVLLGCMGLFGLTTFAVERRVKEVGIRKSLGASVSDIVYRLSMESGYILVTSNLVAWPVGFYLLREWLQQFIYQIDLHIGYFLLAGTVATLFALLTVALQAIPAARANPVESLRHE